MHLYINVGDVKEARGTKIFLNFVNVYITINVWEFMQGDLHVDESLYAAEINTV